MPDQAWIEGMPEHLDFESDGLRRYWVQLDYVHDNRPQRLAWPLVVCRRGRGPSVLVTGGTHGDEFEGQIAATELIHRLDPVRVSGLLLIAPTLNRPACLAGARRSPIDDADLNRRFPGLAGEGPSAAIARFVTSALIGRADVAIDIHSGGEAMEFVLSSNLQGRPGSPDLAAGLPALMAFDAPYAIVFDEVKAEGAMPHRGTLEGAARELRKFAISSEIGGAGRVTPVSMQVARDGLRNLLHHFGVLKDPAARLAAQSRSRLLLLARPEHYLAAPVKGHFVPRCWLGDEVERGQPVADLYQLDSGTLARQEVRAPSSGILVAAARRGPVQPGEDLLYIAEPFSP
ncbi:N-alpha-acetyl diaminobutyric acid deacetylase DoeB [Hypericibacter terrae]|uniref:N-alpha-acetyl diaminobutyric acid deacetylase DoeB n=1 Tax=Hypericibacter terrae TaxID=2602015 RepID=A0A5J6MPT2_9PROT|nr:succinylglutamate desuccinylase/aspartoacylase family protein [Hypericibacter terrae]QEX19393.1 N-alpha-acetyl diaminobutyric acid deacetylase DoeB [Hypericibacter terrae]